jgi:cytochrome c oxidase cbb3-type subunit 1
MEWFVRAFLKSSLAWLGAGVTLGLAMAAWPALAVYRTAHLHFNLLGFVAMMIFGVGYHLLPRLAGHALYRPHLAGVHWVLANLGLALLGGGFALMPLGYPRAAIALRAVGGICAAGGAYLFIYNIWRTLDAGRALLTRLEAERADRPAAASPARRGLPVLQER